MPAAPEAEARAKAERRLVSEAEAAAEGVRPYLFQASPLSVINWAFDARGRLTFAVLLTCEETRIPLTKHGQKQPPKRHIARILYPDREERYEIGPRGGQTFLGSIPHTFGSVPLVPVSVRPDERSDLEDIARIQIAIFNDDQLIEEQIYRQVFNQLVAKVKNKTDFLDNVTGTDELVTISSENNEDLFFLAPQSGPVEAIRPP